MSNAIAIITGAIKETRDDFTAVLADRSISFEREAGFAIQVLQNSEFALKVAMGDKQSVMNAVKNIAAIGISLNPARKQAYLVPRGGKICLDISYIGLIDIAIASGSIMWAQAELVRENDAFTLNGYDQPPTHVFNPFGKDRGEIVGTYVVAKLHNGDHLTTTMSIDEVHSIRNRSESFKKGNGPWKTDEGEMIKKTVIKRAYKLWPKTDRLDHAMNHLNTENGEGLAPDAAQQPDHVDVAPLIAEALTTTTDADALAFWKANNGRLAKQPQDHAKLKRAISDHRANLRAKAEADEARTVEMPAAPAKTAATSVDDEFVQQMDNAAPSYIPE
ncbi:recombination protein RecT [Noviherbaspirillum humi]|uniref:Recombination protein RecT n=1 Tax=Noviherbaspirillum humi TaxID=1688639 RepID=A0A239LT64_9BURK|nr:RecT family recombinase [Noviherbaspirillum humi]SNT33460.1 recombination protein RecT [Noviherbaspirillum humi]